jgi:ADP-ribosylglycohydrolase
MNQSRRSSTNVHGALLGVAVGDALGWPQELRGGLVGGQRARDRAEPEPVFRSWTRQGGHYSRRYDDQVRAGEYSDDTQMTLCVARACMTGDRWFDHLTGVELPAWPLYQRGGGGAVLTASKAWADGHPPWLHNGGRAEKVWKRYVGAGANGVAMRVAPHVVVTTNYDELVDRVFRDGITTHGHPRALVGAIAYAVTLHRAFDADTQLAFGDLLDAARDNLVPSGRVMHLLPSGWGDSKAASAFADMWDVTNREMSQLMITVEDSLHRGAMSNATATLEEIGCADPKINGAGTVTAAAAIYTASRFAARPMQGLLATAFLRKGDTDTLASMTGALLGAIHGHSWLGGLAATVQDADYLAQTADRLASGGPFDGVSPSPDEAKRLRTRWQSDIRRLEPTPDATFPDGRRCHVTDVERIRDDVRRVRLRFEDGQTAAVDTPPPAEDPPCRTDPPRRSDTIDTSIKVEPPVEVFTLSGVTAFTPDLNRATAYYARLLGRDLETRLDETRVTDWFVLRRNANAAEGGESPSVGITVTVSDLAAAARRLGADKPLGSARHFNTRDPDGRHVRVQLPATQDSHSET